MTAGGTSGLFSLIVGAARRSNKPEAIQNAKHLASFAHGLGLTEGPCTLRGSVRPVNGGRSNGRALSKRAAQLQSIRHLVGIARTFPAGARPAGRRRVIAPISIGPR